MAQQQEEKKFHSVYDSQGIYDLPTLIKTSLNMEKLQGKGFFTKKYNEWQEKTMMEYINKQEANPEAKRYYMPEARNTIDTETIRKEADRAKQGVNDKYGMLKEKYGKEIVNEKTGKSTVILDPAKFDSIVDNKGKGMTPTARAKLENQVITQLGETQTAPLDIETKKVRAITEAEKENRLASETPERRKAELLQNAKDYTKKKFKMENAKAQMIANPIEQIADVVSNVGGIINYGRGMRRG